MLYADMLDSAGLTPRDGVMVENKEDKEVKAAKLV